MKKNILLTAILLSFLGIASGEEPNGKALLTKGKAEINEGRYLEAVESLNSAYERLPVVGDYILFYLARAHRELGNLAESNSKIKEILTNYPDSPLRKKARYMEVKNIIDAFDTLHYFQIIESYTKGYPDDYEIKFLFAQLLKKNGEAEKAKAVFKNIYIACSGIFSKLTYNELALSDITLQDIIEKADNLITATEFKEAESILREALAKDDGQYKTEILRRLGHSIFKQKRYKESAEMFEKAGEQYWRASALFRAGDKAAFDLVLKELISTGEKRTGELMIMAALDKRRNGETAEALVIYKNIKAKYPSEAENSLWGIGWTYYRNGNYQKALDTFAELYSAYGNSKYLYWKARSLEKTGKDADHIYRELSNKEQDFYSVLAQLKDSQSPQITRQGKQSEAKDFRFTTYDIVPKTASDIELKPFRSERVDILIELGMRKEAAAELSALAKKAGNIDELAALTLKLQEAGEYRLALSLISRLPVMEITHSILYPLAHWPIVKEKSERYGIDPFIVLSIMREESRFDPYARSQSGALGLMQLMPQTAYGIGKKIDMDITSPEQIHDIETNITIGSYYINSLMKEFNSMSAAIAAYNAGENAVKKWQSEGNYKAIDEFIEDIPYDETRNYAKRVITTYFEYLKTLSGEKEMAMRL